MKKVNGYILAVAVLAAAVIINAVTVTKQQSLGAEDATVMVLRASGRGGGSGVVVSHSPSESQILTNAHVCRAIVEGGVVSSRQRGTHLISRYQIADHFDLCLVIVDADLGVASRVAKAAPPTFSRSTNIGHPQLLPTVISEGRFGDYNRITLVTRFRKCTEQDMSAACIFLGGIPILSTYNSRLSTSLSAPGSSGSPVYNEQGEVAALVFAGRGDIGYAWTVPTESINQFLSKEASELSMTQGKFEVEFQGEVEFGSAMRKLKQLCSVPELIDSQTVEACRVLNQAQLLPYLD